MTLYRNDNNGDVFDAADHDADTVNDVSNRDNWHKVTKADAELPFAEWHPVKVEDYPTKVSSAMDDDLIDPTKLAGPVDVHQSGPTGSASNRQEAPAGKYLDAGVDPKDGQPGPVDVPQSGPTGSEAITAPHATEVDDDGKAVKPAAARRAAARKS